MSTNSFYEMNAIDLIKALLRKTWLILLTGILFSALSVGYAYHMVTPMYESTVLMYVDNGAGNRSNTSISSSDLNAAQSLVDTYIIILNSRTTLEQIIEGCNLEYDYTSLKKMIKADSVDSTEIFKITVRAKDWKEAAEIAAEIADVLPKSIGNLMSGSSAKVIENAQENSTPVVPDYLKYGIWGGLAGLLLCVLILTVLFCLDDRIRTEEDVLAIVNAPVLARIPNIKNSSRKKYKYGYYYNRR